MDPEKSNLSPSYPNEIPKFQPFKIDHVFIKTYNSRLEYTFLEVLERILYLLKWISLLFLLVVLLNSSEHYRRKSMPSEPVALHYNFTNNNCEQNTLMVLP